MTKKNKKKHYLSKQEFIFNFISLIIIIIITLYFGIRSFYYYGQQNNSKNNSKLILSDIILNNNKLVKDGDGLHRNNNGYYFRGHVTNNYLFAFNRMFRIISVSDTGNIKLVSEDNAASFMWGEKYPYHQSNLYTWLTKTTNKYSGVYYNTIPNINKFLIKTTYTEDTLNKKIILSNKKYSDYITTLGINDYLNSGGSHGYLNNNKIFYLMGTDENKQNLYVSEEGLVESTDGLDGYGVRAVITLRKNSEITSGAGTLNNPYVLKQDNNINYIDTYVKLGNDVWKVFNEDNGILKMYLYGYITTNNIPVLKSYSKESSLFDLTDKYNIAYYLNNIYVNSLTYNNYLVPNKYYIGELSTDTGYLYQNIYNGEIECKVGLLNIFDYVSNNLFDDYFHLNNTSNISNIQYSTNSKGLVQEEEVFETKHIVPVISINKNSIKSGSGTINSPYSVE